MAFNILNSITFFRLTQGHNKIADHQPKTDIYTIFVQCNHQSPAIQLCMTSKHSQPIRTPPFLNPHKHSIFALLSLG